MELLSFMVDFTLPEEIDEEFLDLIPEQRTRGAELFKQNRLTSYTLSADRSKLWATFLAKSKRELVYLLDTFPLTPYMQYTIYTLAFNEQNSSASIPVISLN
ncbi:MAG: hypothetical protein IPH02_14670 [Sphingobacteriales bacterium]|nr:hypothetical protein [Sphingobacteriales bacterium]MBK6891140.1 hypothetical protein [Sphingobacteriales bacterium]MBP9141480.1 hypothetical protein [Chitinophagales bacterium]